MSEKKSLPIVNNEEIERIIEQLPKTNNLLNNFQLYQWEGFWSTLPIIKAAMVFKATFKSEPKDVLLASSMKTEKKYRRLKFGSLLKCNFAEGDHILHSENQHLNIITDLIINLAEHSQFKDDRFLKIIETIENLQHKQNKSLEKIEQNFDFLKNQQLDIISKIQTIVANKTIDNNPLESIYNQLENLYKETKEIKRELGKLKDLPFHEQSLLQRSS
ncbi:hypothetical protein H5410_024985 [Solanum commersonii]|uniref:Uncharacterized protein n=1 Tax=Solanum commersonii TaxID=4109 RepID=A0A9J5YUH7_SOLCO|nr:hypothetical protein H5410_024985 [Solanum commersonii]